MEWHPDSDTARSPGKRDLLDMHVRQFDWDDDALEYGSPQRRKVAEWMEQSGLVEHEMLRLFPVPEQRHMMGDYTKRKIWEKITGISLGSKTGQWNWNGLWDPRLEASFCAWVRKLSYTIARTNAKRVLHPKEHPVSDTATDDDRTPEYDRLTSVNLLGGGQPDPFRLEPRLVVPRPIGTDRMMLLKRAMSSPDPNLTDVQALMRDMGWWDRSLDILPPGQAVELLLRPLPARLAPLMERMDGAIRLTDTPDTRDLIGVYWRSQTSRREEDTGGLKRMITRRAQLDECLEWDVIGRLGTMAARLTLG